MSLCSRNASDPIVPWQEFLFLFFLSVVDLQCCVNFFLFFLNFFFPTVQQGGQFLLYRAKCFSHIYIYIYIYIYTHTHTFFFIYTIFHHGLSQEIGYSVLCCTAGFHCFCILNVIDCIYQPPNPRTSTPLPPPPL